MITPAEPDLFAEQPHEPTYREVQDAIASVELHHFRGSRIVACCLTLKDARVVLATAQGSNNLPFDGTSVAAEARRNAEQGVADSLAKLPLQPSAAVGAANHGH